MEQRSEFLEVAVLQFVLHSIHIFSQGFDLIQTKIQLLNADGNKSVKLVVRRTQCWPGNIWLPNLSNVRHIVFMERVGMGRQFGSVGVVGEISVGEFISLQVN